MEELGIWERGEGVAGAVAEQLAAVGRSGQRLVTGAHPAALAGRPLALLSISPGAVGWAGAGAISCRTVLLPGTAGPLARHLRAETAVSYGPSPRDSLTLSSLEGEQICVALQRELVSVSGQVLERQELVLPFQPGGDPLIYLAVVGTLLLLDVPPEQIVLARHQRPH